MGNIFCFIYTTISLFLIASSSQNIYAQKNDSSKTKKINEQTENLTEIKNSTLNKNNIDSASKDKTNVYINTLLNGDAEVCNELSNYYGIKPYSQGQSGLDFEIIKNNYFVNGLNFNYSNNYFNEDFQINYLPIFCLKNLKIVENNEAIYSNIFNKKFEIISNNLENSNSNEGSFVNFTFQNLYRSSTNLDIFYHRNFKKKIVANVGFKAIKGNGSFQNQKRNIQTLVTDFLVPINTNSNLFFTNIFTDATKGQNLGYNTDSIKNILNPQIPTNDTLIKNNLSDNFGVGYFYKHSDAMEMGINYSFEYYKKFFTVHESIIKTVTNIDSIQTGQTHSLTVEIIHKILNHNLKIKSNTGFFNSDLNSNLGILFTNDTKENFQYSLLTKLNYENSLFANIGLELSYIMSNNIGISLATGKNLVLNNAIHKLNYDTNKIDKYFECKLNHHSKNFNIILNPFYNQQINDSLSTSNYGVNLNLNYSNDFLEINTNNIFSNKNEINIFGLNADFYSKNILKIKSNLFENSLKLSLVNSFELTSLSNMILNSKVVAQISNSIVYVGFDNILNNYFITIPNFPYPARNLKFGISWSFID